MVNVIIFTVIILVVGLLIINIAYKKTNHYKNQRVDIREFDDGVPFELSIVNLGSTYSKFAFGYSKKLNLRWGDFSLQAQSLEMDKAILNQYIGNVKRDGVVVVVAAACLLLYRENGTNPLYYEILDKKNNPLYKKTEDIKRIMSPKNSLTKFIKIVKDDKRIDTIYDLYPSNMSEQESNEYIEQLLNVWKKLFNIDNFSDVSLISDNNRKIMDNNVCLLKEIVECCIEHGTVPVIVIPPFSKKINIYFSDDFKNEVLNNNIYKAIEGKNVLFLDYQKDGYFNEHPELFVDGGFRLNKNGSKQFIKRFLNDLNCAGIVINNKTAGK